MFWKVLLAAAIAIGLIQQGAFYVWVTAKPSVRSLHAKWYELRGKRNALMQGMHDRMPVILKPDDHAAWLDPDNQATAELKELLKSYPAKAMAAHPVSTRVNAPKNNDAELLDRV